MTRIEPIIIESIFDHEINDDVMFRSVLINKEFKNVIFLKLDGKCYILIGKNDRYSEACGMNGLASTIHCEWYETTKEEGNRIYKEIKNTKKISKLGTPYYRFSIK